MSKVKEVQEKYKEIENILNEYIFLKARVKNFELDIEEIKISELFETIKLTGAVTTTLQEESENKIQELNQKKRSLEIKIKRIDNILSTLNEKEYKFIELRYFKQLTIKEIADEFFMAETSIQDNRRKILNKLINFKELLL